MSEKARLTSRAAANTKLLRKLNIVTLIVAIVVYLGLLGIAATQGIGPLAVFSTCVMLAALLVFQIVRTLCDHFDLLRNR